MNKKTLVAYHPWAYIQDELEARNRSQKQFAEIIWLANSEVNLLIKGKRNITPHLAFIISKAFWEDMYVWLALQSKWDVYQEEMKEENKEIWLKIQQKALVYA